jgi:hypothetical protein
MRTVTGFFATRDEAERAIRRLKDSGIPIEAAGVSGLDAAVQIGTALAGAEVGLLLLIWLVGYRTFGSRGVVASMIGYMVGTVGVGLGHHLILNRRRRRRGIEGVVERGEIVVRVWVPDARETAVRWILDEKGSRRTQTA